MRPLTRVAALLAVSTRIALSGVQASTLEKIPPRRASKRTLSSLSSAPERRLLLRRGGSRQREAVPPVQRISRTRRGFYPELIKEAEPQRSRSGENSTFCVQQVQGSGDCLFHSIAIGMAFEDEGIHLDMHDPSLAERVSALRTLAVDTLTHDENRSLYLESGSSISVSELVAAAAEQYNMAPAAYCASMRKKGEWGGGPEILALVNALERPIHVFEPISACNGTEFRLQLCGAFGSPRIDKRGKRECIVAADDRFPSCKPTQVKRHGEGGNHFLALLPTSGEPLESEK